VSINPSNFAHRDVLQAVSIATRPSNGSAQEGAPPGDQDQKTSRVNGNPESRKQGELTSEEQAVATQLRQRDREVRAHEAAHLAVGGPYITGGPTYTYQTGPDGRQYAVGGEVSIDTSSASTPEATIRKADIVQAAALAPSNPSPQDFAVASAAAMLEMEARGELRRQQASEKKEEQKADDTLDNHAKPNKPGETDSHGAVSPEFKTESPAAENGTQNPSRIAATFSRNNGVGPTQNPPGQILDLVA